MRPRRNKCFSYASYLLVVSIPLAAACQDRGEDDAMEAPRPDELPRGLILEEAPADVLNVIDAKEVAETGEPIVVRGRVGGSARPFVEGRAVFTIVGEGPKACADAGDHHCGTGWDFCCTPPEELRAHSATIRVVDGDGGPVLADVRGHAGIKELSDLTVIGTVGSVGNGALVVDATGIYVNPPE